MFLLQHTPEEDITKLLLIPKKTHGHSHTTCCSRNGYAPDLGLNEHEG